MILKVLIYIIAVKMIRIF